MRLSHPSSGASQWMAEPLATAFGDHNRGRRSVHRGPLNEALRPTRTLHKSGRRLYVEMTFAIVKGDTEIEVLGAVAMARDVTERVERERAASRSS